LTRASASVAIGKRATKARLSKTIHTRLLYWFYFSGLELGHLVILLSCLWWGWWRHIIIRFILAINDVSLLFFAVVHRCGGFALVSLFTSCDKADEIAHHAKDAASLNRGCHQRLNFRVRFWFLWLSFDLFNFGIH
jgi:hypothetical protein